MGRCYSAVPSKVQLHAARVQKDGFTAPSKLDAPGRTQSTRRASRSVGTELAGAATSAFGTWCSNRLSTQYPNGHLLQRYVTNGHAPKDLGIFLHQVRQYLSGNRGRSGASHRIQKASPRRIRAAKRTRPDCIEATAVSMSVSMSVSRGSAGRGSRPHPDPRS